MAVEKDKGFRVGGEGKVWLRLGFMSRGKKKKGWENVRKASLAAGKA